MHVLLYTTAAFQATWHFYIVLTQNTSVSHILPIGWKNAAARHITVYLHWLLVDKSSLWVIVHIRFCVLTLAKWSTKQHLFLPEHPHWCWQPTFPLMVPTQTPQKTPSRAQWSWWTPSVVPTFTFFFGLRSLTPSIKKTSKVKNLPYLVLMKQKPFIVMALVLSSPWFIYLLAFYVALNKIIYD